MDTYTQTIHRLLLIDCSSIWPFCGVAPEGVKRFQSKGVTASVNAKWSMFAQLAEGNSKLQSVFTPPRITIHLSVKSQKIVLQYSGTVHMCSILIKVFRKISQNRQENTCAEAIFNKHTQVLSSEFSEIVKGSKVRYLTHFMPLVFFYTPWQHQKTTSFFVFPGWYRKRPMVWNGLTCSIGKYLFIKKLKQNSWTLSKCLDFFTVNKC